MGTAFALLVFLTVVVWLLGRVAAFATARWPGRGAGPDEARDKAVAAVVAVTAVRARSGGPGA